MCGFPCWCPHVAAGYSVLPCCILLIMSAPARAHSSPPALPFTPATMYPSRHVHNAAPTHRLETFAVFDPSMAPPGKAVVHAYYAANEPYEVWQGVQRGTPEYEALKNERAQDLWKVRSYSSRSGKWWASAPVVKSGSCQERS